MPLFDLLTLFANQQTENRTGRRAWDETCVRERLWGLDYLFVFSPAHLPETDLRPS